MEGRVSRAVDKSGGPHENSAKGNASQLQKPAAPIFRSVSPDVGQMKRGDQTDGVATVFHDEDGCEYLRPVRAYDNREFLHSRGARHLRIMCEYLEVQARLRRENVMFSILFFGSASALSKEQHEIAVQALEKKLAESGTDDPRRAEWQENIERMNRRAWICAYFEKAEQLARRLTLWARTEAAHEALRKIGMTMPSPVSETTSETQLVDESVYAHGPRGPSLVVCTGGGPGLMEAANRGAASCGGRSVGMGITLPSEPGINKYVSPELAFQFHYFFTRKFWMVYIALALIAMPGGFGTLDELMEVLTLMQTRRIRRQIPIVLFGKEFWRKAVSFDYLIEIGTIKAEDMSLVLYTDDVDEAFEFVTNAILHEELFSPPKKG